jgi:DNA-binding NtrC family response regulator
MSSKILIIEDNDYKREKVYLCVKENFPDAEVIEARSFTSGWKALNQETYKLVCLDMSLPSVDKSEVESGGKFRDFGGRELAQKCKRRGLNVKFVVLTQHKNFSFNNTNLSLAILQDEIEEQFGEMCMGFLFFSNKSSTWKKKLVTILREII